MELIIIERWQGCCLVRQPRDRGEMLRTDTSAVLASKLGHFFVTDYFGESNVDSGHTKALAHIAKSAGIISTLRCCGACDIGVESEVFVSGTAH